MTAIDHISPVWSRIVPGSLVVERGEGVFLFSVEGERYLDFTSGIGVTNTGHAHPKVVKAIQDQAAMLIHGQMNIVLHEPLLKLVDEMMTIMPTGKPSSGGDGQLDSFFFSNSGAEIVEAGVKLAKTATRRPNVIVFSGSFHGRTHLTMSMTTSKTIYRAGYQPLVPGIFVAPFPCTYALRMDERTASQYCLDQLRKLLGTQTAPDETACVVIEPVIGEGGYIVPPHAFVSGLRALCDEYGILLIADEIQTGFGRTGKFFAIEHFGILPDILVMAKGIASGLPLSALATTQRIMSAWKPGMHGGTFGGNVVSCAAAVATIRVMKEEKLVENAVVRGIELLNGLARLQEHFRGIGDVRGLGLMVATEFSKKGEPDPDTAKAVVKAAFDQKLLLLTCGTYDNIIRWIPPLVVTDEQIAHALQVFATALDKVAM